MFSKIIAFCLFAACCALPHNIEKRDASMGQHKGEPGNGGHPLSSDQCITQFIAACNANQAEEIILAIQCIEKSGCSCMSGFSAPNVTSICSSKHGNKCQQVQLGQLQFTQHIKTNPNKIFQAMQKNKHFKGFQHKGNVMHMGSMQFCSSMCSSTPTAASQQSTTAASTVGCGMPSSTAASQQSESTTAQSTTAAASSASSAAASSASSAAATQQSSTMSQASESTTKAASSSSMASSAASTTAGQQSTTSAQQSTTSGMIVGGGGPSTTTAAAQQSSSAQQTTTAAAQQTTTQVQQKTTTAASIQQTTPQSSSAQCIEQFIIACGANELEEIILAIECIQKSGCGCVSGFQAPNVTSICSPKQKSNKCENVNLGAFEMTKVKGQGPNKMLQTVQKHSHLFKGFQHKGNVMHMGQMQFCASNCNVSKHGKGNGQGQNNNHQ